MRRVFDSKCQLRLRLVQLSTRNARRIVELALSLSKLASRLERQYDIGASASATVVDVDSAADTLLPSAPTSLLDIALAARAKHKLRQGQRLAVDAVPSAVEIAAMSEDEIDARRVLFNVTLDIGSVQVCGTSLHDVVQSHNFSTLAALVARLASEHHLRRPTRWRKDRGTVSGLIFVVCFDNSPSRS